MKYGFGKDWFRIFGLSDYLYFILNGGIIVMSLMLIVGYIMFVLCDVLCYFIFYFFYVSLNSFVEFYVVFLISDRL